MIKTKEPARQDQTDPDEPAVLPLIQDGKIRCSLCSLEIAAEMAARHNNDTRICTNCLNMSRDILDQVAPMAANNIRIKAVEEGEQACSFCNAHRYRYLVAADPSIAICDSCVDNDSQAVQD